MDNAKFTLKQLRDASNALRETLSDVEAELKSIDAEILSRCGAEGRKLLDARGQEHGDATFEIEGVKIKYSVTKTVSWDSDKLSEIASSLPDEVRERIFKVKVSIPEKVWSVEAETSIGRNLAIARSVKYGEPKISFV